MVLRQSRSAISPTVSLGNDTNTFYQSKKTCRKQKISFWHYLLDRLKQTGKIPWLPDLIAQSANLG
ncbi:MAG: hypothetical protein ACI82Z_001718 [Cellvibrionaceae bacterium]|jgi:hypothetical protein